jgi:hypothetical protein
MRVSWKFLPKTKVGWRQIQYKRSYIMTGTAIVILILGTVFLLGGTIYFIKLAYDSTKKKKTGKGI